jgi:hypothetical protein
VFNVFSVGERVFPKGVRLFVKSFSPSVFFPCQVWSSSLVLEIYGPFVCKKTFYEQRAQFPSFFQVSIIKYRILGNTETDNVALEPLLASYYYC